MRIGSAFVVSAVIGSSLLFAPISPASAATLSFTDASCADFTIASTGSGNFQVTCNFIAVPICQLTATNTNPGVGSTITLNAGCSGNPTGWTFTGTTAACSPAQSTCADSRSSPGSIIYTVLGSNSVGPGPSASVTVNWQAASAVQAPNCNTPTVSPASIPSSGGPVALNVACTASTGISYTWNRTAPTARQLASGSSSSGTSDTVDPNTGLSGVIYSYDVQACTGASTCTTKSISFTVPGASGTPNPTGFCGQYSDVQFVTLPWGGFVNTAGFRPNGVLVGVLTVPGGTVTPSGLQGQLRATEFGGDPPVDRVASLSLQPCDFGQGGTGVTLKLAYGQRPQILYTVTGTAFATPQLVPGTTYYFNIRNFSQDLQINSCTTPTCNMQLDVSVPR